MNGIKENSLEISIWKKMAFLSMREVYYEINVGAGNLRKMDAENKEIYRKKIKY